MAGKCGRPKGGSTGRDGISEGFLEEVALACQEGRRGKVGESPAGRELGSAPWGALLRPLQVSQVSSRRPGLGAGLGFPALTSAGSDLSAEGAVGAGRAAPAPPPSAGGGQWARPWLPRLSAGYERRLRVPSGRAPAADERAPQEPRDPRTLSQPPAAAREPRT